jgi:hypothetical protein
METAEPQGRGRLETVDFGEGVAVTEAVVGRLRAGTGSFIELGRWNEQMASQH